MGWKSVLFLSMIATGNEQTNLATYYSPVQMLFFYFNCKYTIPNDYVLELFVAAWFFVVT